MTKTYRVTWEIDLDADTPLAAAMLAEEIVGEQSNNPAKGGVYMVREHVYDEHGTGVFAEPEFIDLEEYHS